MTTSIARLEANQRNAQQSTGPRTPEGKAASRLNAVRHGLAGSPDLITAADDPELIAERTGVFARELQAPGELGAILAGRLAVLADRMRRAAVHEDRTSTYAVLAARDEYDTILREEQAGWVAALEGDAAARAAARGLEGSAEGIEHLIGAWSDLLDRLGAADPAAVARARAWLGVPEFLAAPDLLGRARAEGDRLRRRLAEEGDRLRAEVAEGRDDAGIMASFDPSPEATRARRYEAAAERGFFRVLSEIRALRRQAGLADMVPIPPAFAPAAVPPRRRRLPPRLPPRRRLRTRPRPRPPRRWVRSAPISSPSWTSRPRPSSGRSSPRSSPSRPGSRAPTSASGTRSGADRPRIGPSTPGRMARRAIRGPRAPGRRLLAIAGGIG